MQDTEGADGLHLAADAELDGCCVAGEVRGFCCGLDITLIY